MVVSEETLWPGPNNLMVDRKWKDRGRGEEDEEEEKGREKRENMGGRGQNIDSPSYISPWPENAIMLNPLKN